MGAAAGGGFGSTFKKKRGQSVVLEVEEEGDAKPSIFDSETGYWTDTSSNEGSDVDEPPPASSSSPFGRASPTTAGRNGRPALSDRQRLANTLNNWCASASNTEYMLSEGGLDTLIALSRSDDRKVKRECAQAFNRLAALPSIRPRLIDNGAATALISLAYQLKSPKRGLDCAAALVGLTLVPGSEEFLVAEGAVSAFMALMSLGASTVAPVCVAGLYNLTCSKGYYPNVEKVLKAIVNLPFTDRIDPRPLILKAMCNASVSFRLKPRLIEEGSVQILEAYAPRIRDEAGRERAASVLYNLSTSRAVRSDMVVKGCIRCALTLIRTGGPETQFLSAKMLSLVGLDRSSRHRALEDGFLRCLAEIVDRPETEPRVHAAAAQALANISSFQDLTAPLVAGGGIDLLIRLCGGDNKHAKHFCGTAFCNFLKDEECHDSIIAKGALRPLMDLAMDDQVSARARQARKALRPTSLTSAETNAEKKSYR